MKMQARSLKSLLVDAGALAQFADLQSDEQAAHFRNSVYRDFIPEYFWDWRSVTADGERVWRIEQSKLRETWKTQFPIERSVHLIASLAKESEYDTAIKEPSKDVEKMDANEPPVFPYQMAVMFLTMQPWRAQICGMCGKHFVKSAPRDRYCSKVCSRNAVLATKRKSWQTAHTKRKSF